MFFPKFPATKLQDVNLDWLLKKICKLRGGSRNQVLAKASDADFDFKWITGGGGGGTSDYNDLENQPQINNVTLIGNLSGDDIGLLGPEALTPYRTAAAQDAIDATKQAKIAASGMLKGDGDGGVTAAEAGSDYLAPAALNSYRTATAQDAIDANLMALGLTGAVVGDLARVNAVDANGRPTSWKHVPPCEIVTNRNILDNWDFTNPVNQRGQATWSNAGEYTVDRWKLTSGTASLGASGLTLNGTLVQILETAVGQPVTCSALLSDGSMITPTYDDSTKTYTIAATGQTIKAAKIELGSEQTLAHQENGVWVLNEIADYGEELAKCQRYYTPVVRSGWGRFRMSAKSNDWIYFIVPVPVTMRQPVSIINSSSFDIASVNDMISSGFTFSVDGMGTGYIAVLATKQSHGLEDAQLIVTNLNTAFSAEL